MKRLAFLVIFFLMISSQAWAVYETKENAVFGAMHTDPLLSGDVEDATFTVKMGETAIDFPACSNTHICKIEIFPSNYSSFSMSPTASREIASVKTRSCTGTAPNRICTLTLKAHNYETTSYSGGWTEGAKVQMNPSAGTMAYMPLPAPTIGCVLQSTDGLDYSCPTTLNVATINDTVEIVNTADPTQKLGFDLASIPDSTKYTWTPQNKNCIPMCTVDTSFGGSCASVEGTDLGTLTDTYLCTYDLAGTEIDCNTTNAPTASALAANQGTTTTVLHGNAAGTPAFSAITDADGAVVKTGTQTIAGVKTFSSFPVSPSALPSTAYQLANKAYVDTMTTERINVTQAPYYASGSGWATQTGSCNKDTNPTQLTMSGVGWLVGNGIYIVGAGAGGANLRTSVTEINGSLFTLASPCLTTVTSASARHDETVAMQAAIDAAAAYNISDSSAEIHVPGGVYNITGILNIQNSMTIRGEGGLITTFNAPVNLGSDMFYVYKSGNVVGDFHMKDLGITTEVRQTVGAFIHLKDCQRNYMTWLNLRSGLGGVLCEGCSFSFFDKITVSQVGQFADVADNTYMFKFTKGTTQTPADVFVVNSEGGGASISFPAKYGFWIEDADGLWINTGHNWFMKGANIYIHPSAANSQLAGINVGNYFFDAGTGTEKAVIIDGTTSSTYGLILLHDNIYWGNRAALEAIYINSTSIGQATSTGSGIQIRDSDFSDYYGTCIDINAGSKIIVDGNSIGNCNNGHGTAYGIKVANSLTDISIQNNNVGVAASYPVTTYKNTCGVYIGTSETRLYYMGNSFGNYNTTNECINTTPNVLETIYIPTIVGGIGTTDDLILKTTTGAGASGADMIFQTGNNGVTEAARILYNGKIGIGTAVPQSLVDIQGPVGTGAAGAGILTLATKELTIVDSDELGRINFNAPLESDGSDAILPGAAIWAEADDTFSTTVNSTALVFGTATTSAAIERMRIDSAGLVGIGESLPLAKLHMTATDVAQFIQEQNNEDVTAPVHIFYKSRYAASAKSLVASGDKLGNIFFAGYDGTNYDLAAAIQVTVDGTPSSGTDMPGKITFFTSPDGSASVTSRFSVDNLGRFSLTAGNKVTVSGGTAPTIATNDCGSSTQGTVATGSSNFAGKITVGTATVTSCKMTFATAFTNTPSCIGQSSVDGRLYISAQTNAYVTFTHSADMASGTINYHCVGINE